GISHWFGYSHNGYLLVLFKTGVIGLVLFVTGWFLYIRRGIRAIRLPNTPPFQRAILRGMLMFNLITIISTMTLGAFAIRTTMTLMGISWGMFLVYSLVP